jgi:hypothetical protein
LAPVLIFLRGLAITALLAVPLLVMLVGLPQLLELLAPPPPTTTSGTTPFQAAVVRPTVATNRGRFAPAETPPPTLAPPTPTALPTTPLASPRPLGQPATIGNTEGRGAVLRADPVSGRPVASLRERQLVFILERTTAGGAEWAHVRTAEGAEGWVLSVVLQPQQP